MDGPAQRGSRGRVRSPRRGSSDLAPVVVSGVEPGSAPTSRAMRSDPPPTTPSTTDLQVTRSTYRRLTMRGLAPDEAANLTAFLCGIPIAQVHWSLRQVNHLLFLREMARTGRFGPADGEAPRPH